MTVDPNLLQEAVRRGLVPPPAEPSPEAAKVDPALLAEARKRGLIPGEPAEAPWYSKAASAVADTAVGAAKGVADFVTGDSRREYDIPELPSIFTPKGVSDARMSLGRDDLRKFDILRSDTGVDIPGEIDKFGNVLVNIDDATAAALPPGVSPGRYYLNRPGVSGQDVADVVTTAGITAAPAMLGGAAGGLVGVAGAGLGAGVGSAAQDLLAKAAGARQDEATFGIDPVEMLVSAGVGGGSEAMARFVFPYVRKLFSSAYDPAKGFTPEAKRALGNLGINPDDMPKEWVDRFSNLARENVDLQGAAKFADADSLPVKVPLSKGDISRDILDQSFESSAGKGSMGRPALEVMEEFRGAQQAALKENAEAITAKVGTGEAIPPLSGFAKATDRLAEEATGTYRQAGKLYDEATQMGARVDADGVRSFAAEARKALQGNFGREAQKPALAMLDELTEDLTAPAGSSITKTTVKRLEEFRSSIERQARAAGRDESGIPLRQIRDKLDDFLDDAVKNGLITGDVEALDRIKEARGLWRTLKQKYDNDGIVGTLIEFDPATRTYVAALEPEAAARTLFHAEGVGFKRGAEKAARTLKSTLGADSPEWLQIKQETVMRLLRSQETGNVRDMAGDLTFSGDKFSTAFRRAMRDSGELMNAIFSPEDISMLRQFERVALAATNRRSGAVNFSNSAEKALQVLDGFGRQIPGAGWILSPIKRFVQGAGEYEAARQAKEATERGVSAAISQAGRLPAPARGAGAVTGVAGMRALPEEEKKRPTPQ